MTYTLQADRVTLEMTRENFEQLTLMLGFAIGATMRDNNREMFYLWVSFVNDLNNGNPNFTPYEIPPEYLTQAGPPEGGAASNKEDDL